MLAGFAVIAVSSLVGPSQSIAQSAPGKMTSAQSQLGISFSDSSRIESVSRLSEIHRSTGAKYADSLLCSTDESEVCEFGTVPVGGSLVLPPCESKVQENCLESLAISSEGGPFVLAKLEAKLEGPRVLPIPKFGLPEGGTTSIWSITEPHSGPEASLAVTASVNVFTFHKDKGRVGLGKLSVQVSPFAEKRGNFSTPKVVQITRATPDPRTETTQALAISGVSADCIWTQEGRCGERRDFSDGTGVRLVLRVSSEIGGWFSGRMKDASISVEKHSPTSNRITVQGEVVAVPRASFTSPTLGADPALVSAIKRFNPLWDGAGTVNQTTQVNPLNRAASVLLDASKKTLKDTATSSETVWNFSAAGFGRHKCLNDNSKVLGLVTTNAMLYQDSAPVFSNNSLNYLVGGLHYAPDGATKASGTYDLVMRSEVARCFFGFSKAPVSGTITISGDGDKNIATTVVSEKNGWLKLAAYGFTFSEKTIKVKLTQKKTTITCVTTKKPIKTKKVTGLSPKCPKGYKKK